MDVSYLTRTDDATKSIIMEVLSAEWPLSIKKIYFHVKKKQNKSLTYQAVYKSIKEFLAEGVLSRNENGYMISPLWIEKANDYISKLAGDYEKKGLSNMRKIQEFNFNSWDDVWSFLLSKLTTGFFGESKEAYIQVRRFFFMPVSKEDVTILKNFMSEKKVHIMCRANSPIDKMVAQFLTSLGAHVTTGVECARPTSVIIYGDCVISLYTFGERERSKLSEYYNNTKEMKAPHARIFESFNNLFFKGMKIKLIINRDKDVVNDVIEQTRGILSKKF